ncbi:hypothetical protein ABZ454_38750 [Streptomyces sp. NPDC005803]|uniref:hypothetical protein n=1 Tax=Streptomyces sp. NPDC005803 TaxID=3154297 RepID=UPI0033D1DDF3
MSTDDNGRQAVTLSWELQKCAKPDCFRQVKAGVGFCCSACAVAAERLHEVDEHSSGCERRHTQRGEHGTIPSGRVLR